MDQDLQGDRRSRGRFFDNEDWLAKIQLELGIPKLLLQLEIQREIVGRIERERAIVEGNRELIRLYEARVKKVIERVWDG